jgi:hypothetical protein
MRGSTAPGFLRETKRRNVRVDRVSRLIAGEIKSNNA